MNVDQKDADGRLVKTESDMKTRRREIAEINTVLKSKTGNDETIKIWKNFNKYAEYSDLKDLYNKVFPEIRKFEERLIE